MWVYEAVVKDTCFETSWIFITPQNTLINKRGIYIHEYISANRDEIYLRPRGICSTFLEDFKLNSINR